MDKYIARRLLLLIPTLVGLSLVLFLLLRVVPGDPAMMILTGGTQSESQAVREQELHELRSKLGLDRPLYLQYASWVSGYVTFNWGESLRTGRSIAGEIQRRLPLTVALAAMTVTLSLLIALPTGVLSALKQDTWVDYFFRVVTIAGLSIPNFWLGTLVILALVLYFNWIPPIGVVSLMDDPLATLSQLVWPVAILGYSSSAVVGRMTRATVLEVLRQDYIRTAWAKGLRQRAVVLRHALKNALLPVITISGLQFGALLGGTVIMEQIFVLPGMGQAFVQSLFFRDYPMIQTVVLNFAVMFAVVNLLIDVLYAWLDPRIRYT